MQGVFHASLLFLHFDLGSGTDLNEGYTASELGNAFLKLFTIVVARSGFDLLTDLGDTAFDSLSVAGAVNDRRGFLGDFNALGRTQLFEGCLFEREAEVRRDDRCAREHSDVFAHGLAAVAEARSLDSHNLEDAADGVHHEGGESFTVNVFSDDQQRTRGLGNLFENRQEFTDVAHLLVVDQDEGIVEHGSLTFRRVNEVGRQIAAVELHAFNDFEFVVEALAVFDRDHAFLADFVHGLGDDVADFLIGVSGDGADLSNFLGSGGRTGDLAQFFDGGGHGLVDATLKIHRVHAGGNVLHAFANDGLSENRGGGRTVTGVVVGLGGDLLHQLGAHVLKLVLEIDFLGNRHAVLGHERTAEGAFEHHIAALRAQSHLHSVGERVDAANHAHAGVITEENLLCSHLFLSPLKILQ